MTGESVRWTWGLGVGLTLMVVPVSLVLLLTGANEDRVPRGVVRSAAEIPSEASGVPEEPAVEGVSAPDGQAQPNDEPSEPAHPTEPAKPAQPPTSTPSHPRTVSPPSLVPVFAGFEHPRFQMHDALIARSVAAFNANMAQWAGSTAGQARKIGKITVAQVKAHMIQESGGQNALSRAAWKKDPLQVNVPGDWNSYKKYLGLHRPRNRNEGSLETNLKAGIMMLVRKGFGESGQPAANRPGGSFDGWRPALQRYNGRKDLTTEGVPYRVAYASRILKRAASPRVRTDIEIRKK